MTSWLDKLNLRPNELRLVVVVASVVIAVLYFWFIWPQFGEWNNLQKKRGDLEKALRDYQKEIEKTPIYKKQLDELQRKGARVESEAQALELQRIVTSMAAVHGVQVIGYTAGRGAVNMAGKTNAWFEEQTGTVNIMAEESGLVNFLFALSSGDSLIRASSMTLNPDPSRLKLIGNITIVASYPKKAPPKIAAPPVASGPSPAAGVKPAGPSTGPKSISQAVSASAKSGVGTNKPPASSWWNKVKNIFGSRKTTNAPAKGAVPAKTPGPTNTPARK